MSIWIYALCSFYKIYKSPFESWNNFKIDSQFKIVATLFSPEKKKYFLNDEVKGGWPKLGHTTLLHNLNLYWKGTINIYWWNDCFLDPGKTEDQHKPIKYTFVIKPTESGDGSDTTAEEANEQPGDDDDASDETQKTGAKKYMYVIHPLTEQKERNGRNEIYTEEKSPEVKKYKYVLNPVKEQICRKTSFWSRRFTFKKTIFFYLVCIEFELNITGKKK